MKHDFLREVFSRFGDHPDRVREFRKVIIGLAISGKLKPGGRGLSSSDILAEVEGRKAELFAAKQISKPKFYPPVTDEDLPEQFSDPSGFVALGTIARIEKGLTGIKQAVAGAFPLVVTAAERGTCNHFDFDGAAAIIPLVSSTGHGNASINRLHYQEGQFALGTILAAAFPFVPELVSARFIFEYLSTFKDELLVSRMTGTANVTLSIGKIAEVPVPLICPSVQRKIDELMALCDQLEAARESREAERDKLTAASLARLNALDPETFSADARFALANLAPLTTRADQIKQLRQTVLNLALRGQLVKQDPNDEPATEMLLRIRDWQHESIAKKVIRAPRKPLSTIDEVAHPYTKPDGWVFARLGELIYIQSGDGLTAANMKGGRIPVFGGNGVNGRHDRGNVNQPTVVIGRVGYYCGSIHLTPGEAWVTDNAFITHFSAANICINFLILLLKGTNLKEDENATAQPVISGSKIYPIIVGLPPVAEQKRIVAKVDELLALCDQLETSLTEGQQTRSRLLESVLHHALEPA